MKTLTKYGILIVVSNRLYLVLVIGLHTRYGVQIPIYLERGRKRSDEPVFCYFSGIVSIDTYLPREGMETSQLQCQGNQTPSVQIPIYLERGRKLTAKPSIMIESNSIAPYLPREGSETLKDEYSFFCPSVQIPIQLERGRKSYDGQLTSTLFSVQPPIYLARGRKQNKNRFCSSKVNRYRYLSTSRGAGNIRYIVIFNFFK